MQFRTLKELFEYVWATRPHYSEVSGRPLLPKTHPQWHWQFAHILSKSRYTKFKYNPENIMLMLPDEHGQQERYPEFMSKKEYLKRKYYELYG